MNFPKKLRRSAPEVNAGSMADIAFLLLIFFLVTTTILSDNGLFVLLPPWDEDITEHEVDVHERNIVKVRLNSAGELLFCGEKLPIDQLRLHTQDRIANLDQRADWPERANKAVVMLINDRGTRYARYIEVYDALKGAYHDLWNREAQQYGQASYANLHPNQQRAVRQVYPMVISEAEPTDYSQ